MAKAPNAKSRGNSSTFATAISFRTGRRIYQEDKTKKKRKLASNESLVKTDVNLLKIILRFVIMQLCTKSGGSHRIRTCDQLVKSQLLYQLS